MLWLYPALIADGSTEITRTFKTFNKKILNIQERRPDLSCKFIDCKYKILNNITKLDISLQS